MSKWIRKGDRVVVNSGDDKGKTGEVLSRDEDRVLVQGVNVRKKHMKRTQETQQAQTGGRIVEMEIPIHISKVCLCDKEGKSLSVKVKYEGGNKVLVHKIGGKETVYRSVKKPA